MPSPSLLPLVISLIIVSPIAVLRMRKMQKGTKVSTAKTVIFSGFLLGFSIFAVFSSFSIGVPPAYSAIYAAVFAAVALGSYHYANRVLDFWKAADGSVHVRGGAVLMAFYVAALIARIAISSTFGGGPFSSIQSNSTISPDSFFVAIILDVLLVAGAGLLVGRNARILKRFRAISSGREEPRQAG